MLRLAVATFAFVTVGLLFPAVTTQSDQPYVPQQATQPAPTQLMSRSETDARTVAPVWIPCRLTWYSPLQGEGDGTITATGTHVQDNRTVAVDPNVIPLGSIIEVRFDDGTVRRYVAEDTGGAIVGAHIDIYDSNNAECVRNGVQWAEFRIISDGS